MPELPEVETIRRMLQSTVRGRSIRSVRTSRLKLRSGIPRGLQSKLAGRRIREVRRAGKYLLLDLDAGRTLIAHLGMSGRWLFFPAPPHPALPHVHLRLAFGDGSQLWFQDARRFGLLRLVATSDAARDPTLASLGPDPLAPPLTGETLRARARGARASVKSLLLDQRRLAGLGNIYASEVLFRAGVDPRRRAARLRAPEWEAIAAAVVEVLGEAIERMGTTFSMYRTLWGEPGGFADRLRVYDRAGLPCRRCGASIRRIVQGQRATFYCPACQSRRPGSGGAPVPAPGRR